VPLDVIDEQVAEPGSAMQAGFRAWIARRFGPQLERLGWAAAAGEDDPTRLRRAALVRLLGGVAEAPAVLAEARRRLDVYLADRGALEPNLADPVVFDEALGSILRYSLAEVAGQICSVHRLVQAVARDRMTADQAATAATSAVTLVFHNYWAASEAMAGMQETHFRKNLAIMGGAILLYLTGGGRFSLDNWLRQSNR